MFVLKSTFAKLGDAFSRLRLELEDVRHELEIEKRKSAILQAICEEQRAPILALEHTKGEILKRIQATENSELRAELKRVLQYAEQQSKLQ